jgi:Tat protein translocase TatB subunit
MRNRLSFPAGAPEPHEPARGKLNPSEASASVEAVFGIGMPELAVIIVVALVVLGPKRLPEVARSLGKGLAEFRRLTGDVNKELDAARHMIESEAREHERLRRESQREASGGLKPEADPKPDAGEPPAAKLETQEAGSAPTPGEAANTPSKTAEATPESTAAAAPGHSGKNDNDA